MTKPITPDNTTEYRRAMQEAAAMYEKWLLTRKDKRGIELFARRHTQKENYNADV
jgi:hypothetical protein